MVIKIYFIMRQTAFNIFNLGIRFSKLFEIRYWIGCNIAVNAHPSAAYYYRRECSSISRILCNIAVNAHPSAAYYAISPCMLTHQPHIMQYRSECSSISRILCNIAVNAHPSAAYYAISPWMLIHQPHISIYLLPDGLNVHIRKHLIISN